MKKIIQIVLSLILMFSLTACGDSAMESGVDSNTNNNNQNEVQSENQFQANKREVTLEALMNADETSGEQFDFEGENELWVYDYNGTDNMVVIPDEYKHVPVTFVRHFVFGTYSDVEAIRFNDNMNKIGQDVASGNVNLKIVVLGKNTQVIENYAFLGCSSLHTIILNEGLQSIEQLAFSMCKSLKEITIPASVTNIDSSAFAYRHEDFTIYGKAGSYAETYAAENNIPFVAK